MNPILITYPTKLLAEKDTLELLFERGLGHLHVRKPDYDHKRMLGLINRLPKPVRPNVTIHGHFDIAVKYQLGGIHLSSEQTLEDVPEGWEGTVSRSVHSLQELDEWDGKVDYVFLSPIYDSLSKEGYKSAFSEEELKDFFLKRGEKKTKVVALGGIDESNVEKTLKMGFDSVAVLGAVWNNIMVNKILNVTQNIQEICQRNMSLA